ncbi:MAG: response regulator [Desulfobacteraceae bacterium]|nr:MAG: response regulator [Desulfobacteraceae bacterium]
MKILVVDDELVSRKKMMKIVDGLGRCEAAEDGRAAISSVQTALEKWELFDLITLDISMPDMSGTEVLSTIRDLETARGLTADEKAKILMVTAHSDVESVKACVGKCDAYIIKPFNKDVLTEKLKKLKVI